MTRIQQSLIAARELGDEKLQVVTQLQEMIDLQTRQLDSDFKNLNYDLKDDQNECSPKENRSVSPNGYSSAGNANSVSVKGDDSVTVPPLTPSSSSDRVIVNPSSGGGNANSSSHNNANDRNWKRSRRNARGEVSTSRSSSLNNLGTIGKESEVQATTSIPSGGQLVPKTTNVTTTQQSINPGGSAAAGQNKKQSSAGKKRKRKSGRAQSIGAGGAGNSSTGGNQQNSIRPHDDTPPLEETIDPDEPTYCLCDQISFGEMILCDNDLCPIEWFHFSCVSLTTKPKGKWFCPNCRGDRPSVMKPKQQFLKELERYNREKEEKT